MPPLGHQEGPEQKCVRQPKVGYWKARRKTDQRCEVITGGHYGRDDRYLPRRIRFARLIFLLHLTSLVRPRCLNAPLLEQLLGELFNLGLAPF